MVRAAARVFLKYDVSFILRSSRVGWAGQNITVGRSITGEEQHLSPGLHSKNQASTPMR
jgi:hypothetical protein